MPVRRGTVRKLAVAYQKNIAVKNYWALELSPLSCAQRGQRIEVSRRMVAHEVGSPHAEENERRGDRNDGGTDHDGAPFIFARGFPVPPGKFGPRQR